MRGISGLPMLALILAVASLRAEDKPKPIPAPIKEQAMPLRRLAKPLSDRGPFVDPTREIAMAVLLKAPMPGRKRPIPFAPIDLPDPYDRRETIQFPIVLAEDATPVTRFMRAPKR